MSDHTADVCTPKPVGGLRAAMGGELWSKLAGCDVHTQLPRPFLVKYRTGVGKRREVISTVGAKWGHPCELLPGPSKLRGMLKAHNFH